MPPRKRPVKTATKQKDETEVDSDVAEEEEAPEVKGDTIDKLALEDEDEDDDDYDPDVSAHTLSVSLSISLSVAAECLDFIFSP